MSGGQSNSGIKLNSPTTQYREIGFSRPDKIVPVLFQLQLTTLSIQ